ncbi:4Fe-4S dicluster domain-containing protein [Fundidesulfovibrio terrae]|uniref:4Fe-4S dicluster domain-containing protein n=1 Tax=Fundidesulfovibrio terrae TaxID=2922866 RepID=UPI001FB02A7B|nr:4Fe-4S dicluster domain-containing protein [Fundidesulfovibrio terrae]
MNIRTGDEYLDNRIDTYSEWMREGKIPTSSKVIPVKQSLSGLQWILPTEQARVILRNSRSFALAHCACRKRYERCDNPTEVCFYLNDVADKKTADGQARRVTLEEAEKQLMLADAHGLIHMTIYNPEQHVFALCCCCACCCHEVAFLRQYKRPDMLAHSDYIAATDTGSCVHCGACEPRCVFEARTMKDEIMHYEPSKCYGCGLCVSVCPSSATSMELRVADKHGLAVR